jgi:3-oxoadipate enol-lactonase
MTVPPAIELENVRFNYRMDGPAHLPAEAPVLVMSNSLGTDLAMWEPQIPAFAQRFRVLRYDSRGHGATTATPGPYTIAQLARDVIALLDALAIPRAHFCGLSMGGMVGMWLGVNAPERIDRLVLCNTSPKIGTPEMWKTRIDKVRSDGLAGIADAVLERWFTPAFRQRAPDTLTRMRAMLIATPSEGYTGACAAIRDMDQWDVLPAIRRPTLVIAGAHDVATPAADGRRMAQVIAGAKYAELDAAHISNIEADAAFTAAVSDFLGR